MSLSDITLRRAAALRELASLGCWQAKAVALLDLEPIKATRINRRFRISYPPKPKFRSRLCIAIKRHTAAGLKPRTIAARLGTTSEVVRTLLYRMRRDGELSA